MLLYKHLVFSIFKAINRKKLLCIRTAAFFRGIRTKYRAPVPDMLCDVHRSTDCTGMAVRACQTKSVCHSRTSMPVQSVEKLDICYNISGTEARYFCVNKAKDNVARLLYRQALRTE